MWFGSVVNCNVQLSEGFFEKVAAQELQKGEMVQFDQIYPEYLSDINILRCPSSGTNDESEQINSLGFDVTKQHCSWASSEAQAGGNTNAAMGIPRVMNQSYVYYGHVLDKVDDEDATPHSTYGLSAAQYYFKTFFPPCWDGYYIGAANPGKWAHDCNDGDMEFDINGPQGDPGYPPEAYPIGNGNGDTLFRHREGIARFLITDINNPAASARAQSDVPAMWDDVLGGFTSSLQRFNHIPGGSNVLYLDGHVKFQRYPGRWPTARWLAQSTDDLWTSFGN